MRAGWLIHLLADRGIHLKGITKAEISATSDGTLYLIVEGHKDGGDGRRFALFDQNDRGNRVVATERHVVPLGGMVFEPLEQTPAVLAPRV